MNSIQLKIIHYTKTKEDLNLNEKKNQQMLRKVHLPLNIQNANTLSIYSVVFYI